MRYLFFLLIFSEAIKQAYDCLQMPDFDNFRTQVNDTDGSLLALFAGEYVQFNPRMYEERESSSSMTTVFFKINDLGWSRVNASTRQIAGLGTL